jgi:hypothetical protein
MRFSVRLTQPKFGIPGSRPGKPNMEKRETAGIGDLPRAAGMSLPLRGDGQRDRIGADQRPGVDAAIAFHFAFMHSRR